MFYKKYTAEAQVTYYKMEIKNATQTAKLKL
jgi:hypothetical protein